MKTDAAIINYILEITNMNKNQLAVKLGISNGMTTRWSNGDRGITLQNFLLILSKLTPEHQTEVFEFMMKKEE